MRARDLLIPAYTLGVVGALLQLTGGIWDVSWHILDMVETFFTPPHTVVYTGVALVAVAALVGLYVRFRGFAPGAPDRFLLTGLLLALVGGGLQIVAGPIDFWWHDNFGFDPVLFSPPHALLIVGGAVTGIGMGMGAVRLLQGHRNGLDLGAFPYPPRGLHLLAVGGLTALWLGLNDLVYLAADVGGIAYTFGLGDAFVEQATPPAVVLATALFALTGTLVFLSAKRIFGWKGAATSVALLGAAIMATANLAFRAVNDPTGGAAIASFIPLYLAFVTPIAAFDFLVRDLGGRAKALLAAVLLAPFASFLDGFYSLGLWVGAPEFVPQLVVPLLLAGLVAGLTQLRFTDSLVSRKLAGPVRA